MLDYYLVVFLDFPGHFPEDFLEDFLVDFPEHFLEDFLHDLNGFVFMMIITKDDSACKNKTKLF